MVGLFHSGLARLLGAHHFAGTISEVRHIDTGEYSRVTTYKIKSNRGKEFNAVDINSMRFADEGDRVIVSLRRLRKGHKYRKHAPYEVLSGRWETPRESTFEVVE